MKYISKPPRSVVYLLRGCLLLVATLALPVACSDPFAQTPAVENAEELEGQLIKNFQLDNLKLNHVIWEVFAEEAKNFPKKNLLKLRNVRVEYFDHEKRRITYVEADFGQIQTLSHDIVLESNAVIINSNGDKLSGHYFLWNNSNETLSSPIFCLVKRENGDTIAGTGMMADKSLETVTFQNVQGNLESDGFSE